MTRKRKPDQTNDATATDASTFDAAGGSATAVADAPEPRGAAQADAGASHADGAAASQGDTPSPMVDAEGREEPPRTWGDPFKTIFSCPEQGFELGEDRRFKQRVFRFAERPGGEVLEALKQHGFTYRATEKAWTVPADPASRKLTDELARAWAGPNYQQGMER